MKITRTLAVYKVSEHDRVNDRRDGEALSINELFIVTHLLVVTMRIFCCTAKFNQVVCGSKTVKVNY